MAVRNLVLASFQLASVRFHDREGFSSNKLKIIRDHGRIMILSCGYSDNQGKSEPSPRAQARAKSTASGHRPPWFPRAGCRAHVVPLVSVTYDGTNVATFGGAGNIDHIAASGKDTDVYGPGTLPSYGTYNGTPWK
jgi:hypothetical protein